MIGYSSDNFRFPFRARGARVLCWAALAMFWFAAAPAARAQGMLPATGDTSGGGGTASTLYLKLRRLGLDPARVYHIREASLDREDLHITLEDGTIAFMQAVDGRVTGAFFSGSGDILLRPPTRVERTSLSLFTGAAILEENFSTAFLRFNDDTAEQLKPFLRPAGDDGAGFVPQWDETVRNLSEGDALRIVTSFLNTPRRPASGPTYAPGTDHLLRMRVQGDHLGIFDIFFDTEAFEPISVGGLAIKDGVSYFDLWTSFPTASMRKEHLQPETRAEVEKYRIQATVTPPQRVSAVTEVTAKATSPGQRVLFFQLSRFLKVSQVAEDGRPLEFLQNEALDGSALARSGDDLVGVVFAQPLTPGKSFTLKFTYSGDVLGDAGGGLLYVGARGDWYPSRGMQMSQFDLEFRYPEKWTLVATGRQESEQQDGDQRVAHWVSERVMPLAGFNVGRYERSSAHAGPAEVDVYAAPGVEAAFHHSSSPDIVPDPFGQPRPDMSTPRVTILPVPAPAPPAPEPQRNAERMAASAAHGLEAYARMFGPYPYGHLSLTQNPGHNSQGWPGLVFLSTYSFLTPSERKIVHLSSFDELVYHDFMQLHETAHQWWGDLIAWSSYRDQWLLEALANYSALLVLEQQRPGDVRQILEHYRTELATKQPDGDTIADAGPVTLGGRLNSSRFPRGFDAVSYGRGTWLLQMLRSLMRDAAEPPARKGRMRNAAAVSEDEPFLRGLRLLRERYEGRTVSTQDFVDVMTQVLPENARYEGKKSLEWFLDGWINGNAMPSFALRDVKFGEHGGARTAAGSISEDDAPQDLVTPVPVYAVTANGKNVYLGRVWVDSEKVPFRFPVPAGTRKLVLDPYQSILTKP